MTVKHQYFVCKIHKRTVLPQCYAF